jgi:hypothetical protein
MLKIFSPNKSSNNQKFVKESIGSFLEYSLCWNGIFKINYLFIYLFDKYLWKLPRYYSLGVCSTEVVPIALTSYLQPFFLHNSFFSLSFLNECS